MRLAGLPAALLVFALPAALLAQPERPLSAGEQIFYGPATSNPVERLPDVPPRAPDERAADRLDASVGDAASPLEALLKRERRIPRKDPAVDAYWEQAIPQNDFFKPWQWSLSYMTGYVGVNLGPLLDIPFEMLPQLVRLNCMWNRPRPNKIFKGTWEGIAEVTCMPVTRGPATIVIGGSLMLRYNFGAWKNRIVTPYFQMGGGGMYTDEWLFDSPVLSSGFEFIIQNAIGVNIKLGHKWALNGEWGYYHFSNGGIVMPNISVNQLGGLVGLTYYFGRRNRN